MRKTSRTFLTVGSVLGFIFGALFLILGLSLAVVGKMKVDTEFLNNFQDIIAKSFNGSVAKFQNFCFIYGVAILVSAACRIAGAIFCIITKKKPTIPNCVVVMVLSVLGGGIFSLLGGIFGLVATARKQPYQA